MKYTHNRKLFFSGVGSLAWKLQIIHLNRRKVKVKVKVKSCPTLCDPMDGSLIGSKIHGVFQARILEWAAISFSRGSFHPRDRTWVFCIADRHFTVWATRVILLIEEKLITKKVKKLSYVSTTSDGIHEHSTMPLTRVLRVDAGCSLGAQQILSTRIQEPLQLCSVQFSRSVMSDFLQPHGLQHARLPCPSPTP